MTFLWRAFFFLPFFFFFFFYSWVDSIYFIFGVWLESRVPFLSCPRYFRLSFPGGLARASPHLVTTMSNSRLIFFLPTSADGRSSHFRPRAPANHLASLFFSLVRWSVRATICHPLSHSLSIRSPSTNICFFHSDLDLLLWDWPTLSLLTVILWRLANSSTRNSSNLISSLSGEHHVTVPISEDC